MIDHPTVTAIDPRAGGKNQRVAQEALDAALAAAAAAEYERSMPHRNRATRRAWAKEHHRPMPRGALVPAVRR